MTSSPRERWRHWYRLWRLARHAYEAQPMWQWRSISESLRALRPAIQSGDPSEQCYSTDLAINGSTPRIRWLYRCWRYGHMPIAEAKERLYATGLLPPLIWHTEHES